MFRFLTFLRRRVLRFLLPYSHKHRLFLLGSLVCNDWLCRSFSLPRGFHQLMGAFGLWPKQARHLMEQPSMR